MVLAGYEVAVVLVWGTVSPSVGDVGVFCRREWHRLALVWSLPQSVSPTAPSSEGAVDVFSSSIFPFIK